MKTNHAHTKSPPGAGVPPDPDGNSAGGCSSTRPVKEQDPYAALDRIKKETADGEARVTLVDGTVHDGHDGSREREYGLLEGPR